MFNITEKNYIIITDFFKNHQYAKFALKICYSLFPLLIFIGYPVLILYVLFTSPYELVRVILVPLGVFVTVTVLRKLICRQRPYEKYKTESVFGKTTKGHSMPSRHTASAFVISMAMLYVNFDFGVLSLSVSVMIMLSRVLAGVHFLSDVIVGMCISVIAGIIFFFLI